MGKKILALGMIVCLFAGFAGCSRKLTLVKENRLTAEKLVDFKINDDGGFYISSSDDHKTVISRFSGNGKLIWEKDDDTFDRNTINGVIVDSDFRNSTISDPLTAKYMGTVEGDILYNQLDGKSLLFEKTDITKTKDPDKSIDTRYIIKSDLRGKVLWKTKLPTTDYVYVQSFDGSTIYLNDCGSPTISHIYVSLSDYDYNDVFPTNDFLNENSNAPFYNLEHALEIPKKKPEVVGNFYMLDFQTGKIINATSYSSLYNAFSLDIPKSNGKTLMIESWNLSLFDSLNGKIIWTIPIDVREIPMVDFESGQLLVSSGVATEKTKLTLINLRDGSKVWEQSFANGSITEAKMVGDKLILAFESTDIDIKSQRPSKTSVIGCNYSTGKIAWETEGFLFNNDDKNSTASFSSGYLSGNTGVEFTINFDNFENINFGSVSILDRNSKDTTISGKYLSISHYHDEKRSKSVIDTQTGKTLYSFPNPFNGQLKWYSIDGNIINFVTSFGMAKYWLSTGQEIARMRFSKEKLGLDWKDDASKDDKKKEYTPNPSVKDGLVFIQGKSGLTIYDLNTFEQVYFSQGERFKKFDVIDGFVYLLGKDSLLKFER